MMAKLRKAVTQQFQAMMKTELPEFALIDAPGTLGANSLVYMWSLENGFSFFIKLFLNPKAWEQSFMVEAGWNKSAEFPMAAIGKWIGLETPPKTSPHGLLRLPALYQDKWESAEEPWWWLGPKPVKLSPSERAKIRDAMTRAKVGERTFAMIVARDEKEHSLGQDDIPVDQRLADVDLTVRDAIEKIKVYGLPFMKAVAAAHKIG